MNLAEQIKKKFSDVVTAAGAPLGDETVYVEREGLLPLMKVLKTDPAFQFDMLMDLFGMDFLHWEEKALRFEVVYNLYSSALHHRFFVKVGLPEKEPVVDSVAALWPAADWYEREVWDMFGVSFKGHPNLKRILMYEEFKGHPLRKDYAYNLRQPLIGPIN